MSSVWWVASHHCPPSPPPLTMSAQWRVNEAVWATEWLHLETGSTAEVQLMTAPEGLAQGHRNLGVAGLVFKLPRKWGWPQQPPSGSGEGGWPALFGDIISAISVHHLPPALQLSFHGGSRMGNWLQDLGTNLLSSRLVSRSVVSDSLWPHGL